MSTPITVLQKGIMPGLRKRRVTKQSKKVVKKITGSHEIACTDCQTPFIVSADVRALVCADCVQKMIAPPPMPKKKGEADKKPRGWHFKLYFEHNGIVYSKGVIVTGSAEITKLKKLAASQAKPVAKKVAKKVKKTVAKVKSVRRPQPRVTKNASNTK